MIESIPTARIPAEKVVGRVEDALARHGHRDHDIKRQDARRLLGSPGTTCGRASARASPLQGPRQDLGRFERDLRAWLETPEGRFAAWRARADALALGGDDNPDQGGAVPRPR